MESTETAPQSKHFPIVGIGASAGGLVALQQFLSHLPPGNDMAVVIVQHQDPDREGMLVELLQHHSAVPVAQATDQMVVQPGHVYVIPPGQDLTIKQGQLHLLRPPEPHGLRLPIDTFFHSLALECEEHSIGVILSGMGADGTLGLGSIHKVGGGCFAQTPASAQFDSMPRSAIDSGVVDAMATPEELPLKIAAFTSGTLATPRIAATDTAPVDPYGIELLDKVILELRSKTGHDFSAYKKNTVVRRIERRMALHQLDRLADYLRYLRESPQEAELLFNELLIGVTSFFRDPSVWEQLRSEVFPALLAGHPKGAALRAWVPACSTGEEAFSMAMAFKEALEAANLAHRYSLQIFASDVDKDAIATARTGIYPVSIASDLSERQLNRFFVTDIAGYKVSAEIREMVVFAEQNLIADPPFTRLDILSCRNFLIYLEPALQAKLIQLFHYSLKPGAILVLGSAESLGSNGVLFSPLPGKSRIFRRVDTVGLVLPPNFPAAFGTVASRFGSGSAASLSTRTPASADLQALVEKNLLQRYAPAALLVNEGGELLYVSGKTGKYLEPPSGRASLNLFAMAREGLKQALAETLHRSMREKSVGTLKGIKLDGDGGKTVHRVDVTVHPLAATPSQQALALIAFADAPRPKRSSPRSVDNSASERVDALVKELLQAREDAQATREEMQASQEELKSTNEELQSTNEELQSTNEELTTSKEEMQSMNEELQTINHELQAKVSELSRASTDMKNLLDSTEIATLFLDDALNVRRFTSQTARIIKLIPGDADRPITDITTELDYPDMVPDARTVLRTLEVCERDVPATQNRWFKVRIMPYRAQNDRVDGLVLTFANVTQYKLLEAELRAAQVKLAAPTSPPALQDGAGGLS